MKEASVQVLQRERDEAQLLLAHTALERDAAKAKLQALLKRYFGRSSEKLDPNQLALAWAAVEADQVLATPPPPAAVERQPRTPSVRRAQRLEDLPVLERIIVDLPEAEKIERLGSGHKIEVVVKLLKICLQRNANRRPSAHDLHKNSKL
jgi:hypothetical protein